MECYCDYEWPTVYRKAVHTACKEHRCYECHRTIRPGERYESVFAVWGGKGKVAPTCQHCLALRDFVLAHVPCSCWTHGNMREEVLEDAREWSHETDGRYGYVRPSSILRVSSTFEEDQQKGIYSHIWVGDGQFFECVYTPTQVIELIKRAES